MRNNQRIRTYSELITLRTFEERYDYLRLSGSVGTITFGFDRYLNQLFYNSDEWKTVRREVIIRDHGCDLGIPGLEIEDGIRVHHMNPIDVEDLKYMDTHILLDPEFLISTSLRTHNAIHFGDKRNLISLPKERYRGDTKLW